MQIPQWVKDIPPFVSAGIALLALFVSSMQALINFVNYRRDRHKVRVDLKWNAEETRAPTSPTVKSNTIERIGHITVKNVGRRPVSIDFIGLHLPGRKRVISWLEPHEVRRLEEGSAPIVIRVYQDSTLEPFLDQWKKIRASATDTAGGEYTSKHGGEPPIIIPGYNQETRRRLAEPVYDPPPKPPRRFARFRK